MLLNLNDPRVANAPDTFDSPFPSDSALYSRKYEKLINQVPEGQTETLGRAIYTRANARAWRDVLALGNAVRMSTVGVLTEWLPELASIGKLPGGLEGPIGLFAEVAFQATTSEKTLFDNVAVVALDLALDNLGAVPIVGGCLKFILGLGSFLDRLFEDPAPEPEKKLLLPWTKYAKGTDEDLVRDLLVNTYAPSVDLTPLWLPPYELDVPWAEGTGVDEGREVGKVFAPIKGGEVAYGLGLGGMPGTWRVAGHLQAGNAGAIDPRLERYFSDGTRMRWGRATTRVGDFYPGLAQGTSAFWNQVNARGAPDMYCVDTVLLEERTTLYWDMFFDGVWRAFRDDDEWAGEWAAPYLAVRTQDWRIGLEAPGVAPYRRPHPAPLITPAIFAKGAGTEATRNLCLYLESIAKGPTGGNPPGSKSTGQVGTTPKYVLDERGRAVASGGPAVPPDKVSPGLKCIAWPDGSELLVKYARPDHAILVPAIRRLRDRQRSCLRRTLVSAYVRPVAVGDLPAYGAFAHPQRGKELRELCLDMRQKLLAHEARFAVILKDVDVVDPPFAKKLRDSGVNNSLGQLMGAKQKLGKEAKAEAGGVGLGDGGEDPIPEPLPPEGGLPFPPDEADLVPPPRPWKKYAAAGGAAIAGYLLTR